MKSQESDHEDTPRKLAEQSSNTSKYQKLEDMALNKIKLPIKKPDNMKTYVNVTRNNPYDHPQHLTGLDQSPFGKPTLQNPAVDSVIKHDYLRKSMVERIEKKNAENHWKMAQKKQMRDYLKKPNKAYQLRSMSIQDQISKHSGPYRTISNDVSQTSSQGYINSASHISRKQPNVLAASNRSYTQFKSSERLGQNAYGIHKTLDSDLKQRGSMPDRNAYGIKSSLSNSVSAFDRPQTQLRKDKLPPIANETMNLLSGQYDLDRVNAGSINILRPKSKETVTKPSTAAGVKIDISSKKKADNRD